MENINFNGHNIVLGSLFLTTGEESYIGQTIIDGDSAGSVVTFNSREDSTAIIIGFTLQNGFSNYGGGVSLYNSDPKIIANHIVYNRASSGGAGIECYVAHPSIINNIIKENICEESGSKGGGIYCNGSNAHIDNNIIMFNYSYYGDGIYCRIGSNPLIENNFISENLGPGIYIYYADPIINNNTIIRNRSSGIISSDGSPTIYGNFISDNESNGITLHRSDARIEQNIICFHSLDDYGGGIRCNLSKATIINNTISQNSYTYGGGIYCNYCSPIIMNCLIWGNNRSIYINGDSIPEISYCSLQEVYEGEGNINDNPLFIDPAGGNFNICNSSTCIDAGDPSIEDPDGTRSDIGAYFPEHFECFLGDRLYVSVQGSDSTGDGSQQNPFLTIQNTINNAIHGDTVIVQNGLYVENINMYGKKITLSSEYVDTYDYSDVENTIIDGDSLAPVVRMFSGEDGQTALMGFTIRHGDNAGIRCNSSHPLISHNIIEQNYGTKGGGIHSRLSNSVISHNIIRNNITTSTFADGSGIYIWGGSPIVKYNYIYDNMADAYNGGCGGGIYTNYAPSVITNNLIYGNRATGYGSETSGRGGGIYCSNIYDPLIANNTIYGNSAGAGGGIFSGLNCNPTIINNILWGDSSYYGDEIYLYYGTVEVSYSNIDGGYEGIGNINQNPLFRVPDNGDFHLMAIYCNDPYDSPCIDAGHPDSIDFTSDCDWGLGTLRADMGAYGGGDSIMVGIADLDIELPDSYLIAYNYPNPFNTITSIHYHIPESGKVRLDIYDILGRKLQTLLNRDIEAGSHKVDWNATGYSTGVYFYKISIDDKSYINKCALIK